MTDLPSGTVTFLFTDIEGSTQLWEQSPESMKSALARHDAILRDAVESNHGYVIKTTGDGCHAAFSTAIDAAKASLAAQRGLQNIAEFLDQPKALENPGVSLRVRMGLHTGEAEARAGDYFGQALNRAARLMAAGRGGQILVSRTTADLVREHLPADASLLDLGEHRLKDLIQPEQVFQLSAVGLPYEFPPLRSLNAIPNNLPLQLTSFIGREHEMDELNRILPREGTRLLTLIGPGGTGKTRLSLQLAAEQLSEFKDGVWLVELAPVSDPGLILQTVASVLSLREQLGMPLADIALNYLRAKQLLLILDNCEHLVEACAELAEQFLQVSLRLKILASSREALGVSGEIIYRVPSLSLPGQEHPSPEGLARSESAQLFVERATATNPKFSLTISNAPYVAQICQRLDGIPLAIELAAARATVFTPEQIAGRLDDRFRLLTGGSRTALPRQQTLRALIDWSYDVLTDDECRLLRRLSVFVGGWTFEAAEALCPDLDLLELLPQLVNKSLVVVDEEAGASRYRLLETIRQYARDKLLDHGEAEQTRKRHLAYFGELAENGETKLWTDEALLWVNRFEADHDNLRAAIAWGLDNDLDAALHIVAALPNFWFRRGYETEGRRLVEQALAKDEASRPGGAEPPRDRKILVMRAWQSLCFLEFSQGDQSRAIMAADKCATLARELGDDRVLAMVLGFAAAAKLVGFDQESVDQLISEAVEAARRSGDKYALGIALGLLASRMMADPERVPAADAYAAEGLALLKESGNRFGYLMMQFSMAMGARFAGRFDDARSQMLPLYPMFLGIGDRHRANMIRSELAHIDRIQGRYDQAEAAYRETILDWQRLGHQAAVAHQLESFGFIAKMRNQLGRAARLFGAAEALRERIDIQMTKFERAEYERQVAELRASLGENDFEAAWAQGGRLTMEEAVQVSLEREAA
jgi:predicted ATPase/class 3 adenylate cyclase